MNLKSVKIIAVDFDGTLCENNWPGIGAPNEELIEYLRNRKKDGDKFRKLSSAFITRNYDNYGKRYANQGL